LDVKLAIQDNGKGFDLADAADGNGLVNMKRPAEEINADFTIQFAYDKGTSFKMSMKII
jgi:signal transduction histidine kinase